MAERHLFATTHIFYFCILLSGSSKIFAVSSVVNRLLPVRSNTPVKADCDTRNNFFCAMPLNKHNIKSTEVKYLMIIFSPVIGQALEPAQVIFFYFFLLLAYGRCC